MRTCIVNNKEMESMEASIIWRGGGGGGNVGCQWFGWWVGVWGCWCMCACVHVCV